MNFDPLPRKKLKQIWKTGFVVTQIIIFLKNRHLSFEKKKHSVKEKNRVTVKQYLNTIWRRYRGNGRRNQISVLYFANIFIILVYCICNL